MISNNTQGNKYHDESTGQFTSGDNGSENIEKKLGDMGFGPEESENLEEKTFGEIEGDEDMEDLYANDEEKEEPFNPKNKEKYMFGQYDWIARSPGGTHLISTYNGEVTRMELLTKGMMIPENAIEIDFKDFRKMF